MDFSEWYAVVKYLCDEKQEKVPVSNLKLKNSKDLREHTGEKYRQFEPTHVKDFDPNKVYRALTVQNVRPNSRGVVEPTIFKCYIGAMAGKCMLLTSHL